MIKKSILNLILLSIILIFLIGCIDNPLGPKREIDKIFYEDWESKSFDTNNWKSSGDVSPFITKTEKFAGEYSVFLSGSDDMDKSYIILEDINIETERELNFYLKTSSENKDKLRLYINDNNDPEHSWGGIRDWQKVSIVLTPGEYKLEWKYEKDGSGSDGSDGVWIDDIVIQEPLPIINVSNIEYLETYSDFAKINEESIFSFTIKNIGNTSLTIDDIVIENGDFEIFSMPDSSIEPKDTTTLILALTATSESVYETEVEIYNGDLYYDPFKFTIKILGTYDDVNKWLFMMYMDGDNNLDPYLWSDINEMEYGLSMLDPDLKNSLKIIVLWDGLYPNNGGPEKSYLYELSSDNSINSTISKDTVLLTDGWFENGDEVNMGDKNTLSEFINYCREKYPAYNKDILIMSNHGSGVKSNQPINKAGWSDDTDGDKLFTNELQEALVDAQCDINKLSVLGFDVCLLGVIEEAYEYRDLAEYYIASPQTEQGDGWEFEDILISMYKGISTKEVASEIVNSYRENFIYSGFGDQTLTAVDLSKMEDLKTAIDNLAAKLYAENEETLLKDIITSTPAVEYDHQRFFGFLTENIISTDTLSQDLKTAAQDAKDALGDSIVYAVAGSSHNGGYDTIKDDDKGHGLCIVTDNFNWYTDKPKTEYNYHLGMIDVGEIDFANTTDDGVINTWCELLKEWY